MRTHVQPGDSLDFVAPSGGVVAGMAYKIGLLIHVAATTALEGASYSGDIVGVFDVPAATSQAWTQGVKVYWDDTAKTFTTTASGNTACGHAAYAKDSAAAIGKVRLQPL
ncbi:MAG: DUF2190 family protein [Brevundimonas sp.]|uniref:DUF2190 family protein n=1 Tax=Brevundimonas sp. TaxID=1871086 RepID=UPI0027347CDF|nr:DUF2190 family protein [Brevundimonas sp.]MDP3405052.1 DUF2190 family protein [Brevundimonas sp.]